MPRDYKHRQFGFLGSVIALFLLLQLAHDAAIAQFDPRGSVPGLAISPPQILNMNAVGDSGSDHLPRLAGDGAGHIVAVWESNHNLNGTTGTDYDIFVARSSDFGATWSSPVALNSTASSDGIANDTTPVVATDGIGLWICVWECRFNLNGVGTDADVFVSRSTDNGATWTAAAPLNTNATTDTGHDYDPQVATDGNGRWLVIWRSLDSLTGTIGSDADIVFSRSPLNAAAGSWTTPQPLNSNAVGDTGHDVKPRLAFDGEGRWIAVWESNDSLGATIGNDYDILFSRANWTGGPTMTWAPPTPLNSNAASDSGADGNVSLATDRAGNLIVAWNSTDTLAGSIGSDLDILFSRSVDHGTTWSPVAPLNSNAASDSGTDATPSMNTNGAGDWIAVWNSNTNLGGTIGADLDLLMARSVDGGASWSALAACNLNAAIDSGADEFPCLLADASGAWLIAWETRDNFAAPNGGTGTEGDLLVARFALPDCNENFMPDGAESDCNNNAIPDSCDISAGTSLDVNSNGVPDECESTCLADCAPQPNGDGVVNVNDLLFIINNWGQANTPADIAPPGGDGTVNVNDLLAIINNWGACP